MARYKKVEVAVPELKDLPLDPEVKSRIDSLCTAYRSVQDNVAPLEETKRLITGDTKDEAGNVIRLGLKSLAESLGLPERVLGETWDLRRTVRESSKVNEDRLKIKLLEAGWDLAIVNRFVEECTDTSVSVSWSVYGRDKGKERP